MIRLSSAASRANTRSGGPTGDVKADIGRLSRSGRERVRVSLSLRDIKKMLQFVRRSSPRGLTRVEGVVLLALLGIVALFGVTYLRAIPRRERILRAARDVQTLLLSARASA